MPQAPPSELRLRNERAFSEFARALDFRLEVAGSHKAITHQELLGVLESQGRPFAITTERLKTQVFKDLQRSLGNSNSLVTTIQMQTIAQKTITEWVTGRFDSKIKDISLRPLTPSYATAKKRAGFGNKPIGIRTGQLRDAVSVSRVIFK